MRDSGNILFCGVGGQGILLASEVTSYALMGAGFDVKKSEVHGMAQRGGSVVAHLRYGQRVYAPLIEPGRADIEVSFELLESLRYLQYLGPGSRVIVNTQRIFPPSVCRGLEKYPENVVSELERRGIETFKIDALGVAREVGELRAVNMVLVGAMSSFLPIGEEAFLKEIERRVKKGFEKVNAEAFTRGRGLTSGAAASSFPRVQ